MSGRGLDWAGLMRAGLQGLRLRPAEFWELTPAELALMLGVEPGAGTGVRAGAMSRSGLDALMARFPDAAAAGAVRQFKE